VLSLPDLCSAALIAHGTEGERLLRESMRRVKAADATEDDWKQAIEEQDAHYGSGYPRALEAAVRARTAFLDVLQAYFAWRHYEDSHPAAVSNRQYLQRELDWLDDGDTVITTNWDTLAERTLIDNSRWTPADGYGFGVDLVAAHSRPGMKVRSPAAWIPTASAVKVLKLHGSYGWRLSEYGPRVEDPGHVKLDYEEFLSVLPFRRGDTLELVRDRRARSDYDQTLRPLMFVPSYLKQLTGASIQQVWNAAAESLRHATEVKVIGYSLPESDVGIRSLLNPLRFRLEQRDCRVAVYDPANDTRERWQLFLGANVEVANAKAGQTVA
jgi:hypothetical protein